MPVNDDLSDKELAVYLRRGTIHDFQVQAADRLEQQAAEIEWLRAALAAQPQPLFRGTLRELNRWTIEVPDTDWTAGTQFAVYPAVAGSATPTDGTHLDGPCGDDSCPFCATERYLRGRQAVAGSATPTEDDG